MTDKHTASRTARDIHGDIYRLRNEMLNANRKAEQIEAFASRTVADLRLIAEDAERRITALEAEASVADARERLEADPFITANQEAVVRSMTRLHTVGSGAQAAA